MAQPAANCTESDDGYNCTVYANNTALSLPFYEQTDDNNTAYVVFCASDSDCSGDNSQGWLYILAFTNTDDDTQVIAYANVNPAASDPDFCDAAGYCISTETLADSTCEVYGYCPGIAAPDGEAVFSDGTNTITILPLVTTTSTPLDPCAFGPYCDSAGIIFNGPAGTSIVLSAGNSPNIGITIPAGGTYTQIVLINTAYSYVATLPGGSTVTGSVTTGAAYSVATVTIT